MNHEVESYPGELRRLRELVSAVQKVVPDVLEILDIYEELTFVTPPVDVYGDDAG